MKSAYCGIIITAYGIIIVLMITAKKTSRPKKRKRAKPYAISALETTVPIVTSPARMKLLSRNVLMGNGR